jgi:hypothetical protein
MPFLCPPIFALQKKFGLSNCRLIEALVYLKWSSGAIPECFFLSFMPRIFTLFSYVFYRLSEIAMRDRRFCYQSICNTVKQLHAVIFIILFAQSINMPLFQQSIEDFIGFLKGNIPGNSLFSSCSFGSPAITL